MEEKNTYNVLRLVSQGNWSYVSMDLIRGKPLIHWLKYHPVLSKEQVYQWMREIIQSLEAFHKCQGEPSYQYVNPYSIIVSEENKLYLLDLGNKKHEDLLHQMQRRIVREYFLSPENLYYQLNNEKEDLYSLGKTLQYLLATIVIEPKLSKWEEWQLRRLISKCLSKQSKKSYQTIQELSEHFPKRKEVKNRINIKYIRLIILGILCLILIGLNLTLAIKQKNLTEQEVQTVHAAPVIETKVEVKEKELTEEEKEIFYEYAMCYLLDYEDVEKSIEILNVLEDDRLAEDYGILMKQLQRRTLADTQFLDLLTRLEKECDKTGKVEYYLALTKGYKVLGTEKAQIEIERLYKKCLYQPGIIFSSLWEEKNYDVLLRTELMEMKCGNPEMDRNICAQSIQELLEEKPEIKNSDEFKVLQKKYEIVFEEDKVCVKK